MTGATGTRTGFDAAPEARADRSHTMVFADDGSTQADVAWLWVTAHLWPRWRVEIVTASPPRWDDPAGRSGLHEWEPRHERPVFAESGFAAVTYLTASADPRLLLLRPAAITVIGEHGPGLLKRVHLAGTMNWLLRSPSNPLLIARHGITTERVLVCHDGSEHADAAMAAFVNLPWAHETRTTVVSVEDEIDARSVSAAAVARLGEAGVLATPLVVPGATINAIERVVRELEPDLLVLGTAGKGGVERLTVGSTATAVTRDCPASVLAARATIAA